jgi:hypothetical protein
MLTPEDIEFMKEARAEIIANRTSNITLIYEDGGTSDPITGETTEPTEVTIATQAVVTELSSQVKYDKSVISGVEVTAGDIWFSVGIAEVDTVLERLLRVIYDGKTYELLSRDKKGIGARNRVEFVGRRIT